MDGQGNEGDEIVLLALRSIECKIPEQIKSVKELTAEMIVEVVARSLWLISNGEVKFSVLLPTNIASRHRICTNMASKVKDLGFTGDCGYNQLLYPVEAQTRQLMAWLVQKLPRSEEERAEEVLGANALLNKRIISSLVSWRTAQWRLAQCASGTPLRNVYDRKGLVTVSSNRISDPDVRRVYSTAAQAGHAVESSIFERHALQRLREAVLENNLGDMEAVARRANLVSTMVKDALNTARRGVGGGGADSSSRQADQLAMSLQDLVASIGGEMDGSARAQGGGRFAHASAFAEETGGSIGGGGSLGAALNASLAGLTAEDAEIRRQRLEAEEGERQQELEDLRNAAQVAQGNLDALERQQGNASSKIRQLDSELAALLNEGEALEKEIMIKRKTLEMLPSAAENIGKLQAICGGSAKRLMQLAQEWETHRRPLVDKLRGIKASKMQRRNKCRQMVDEMKARREEMAGMIQDLKDKQTRAQTLAEELNKLPKNINRTLYTHRIMDIISSIGKQNRDIDKITNDIRDIQKTINQSTLSLQRADAVAEELIYQVRVPPSPLHFLLLSLPLPPPITHLFLLPPLLPYPLPYPLSLGCQRPRKRPCHGRHVQAAQDASRPVRITARDDRQNWPAGEAQARPRDQD